MLAISLVVFTLTLNVAYMQAHTFIHMHVNVCVCVHDVHMVVCRQCVIVVAVVY